MMREGNGIHSTIAVDESKFLRISHIEIAHLETLDFSPLLNEFQLFKLHQAIKMCENGSS